MQTQTPPSASGVEVPPFDDGLARAAPETRGVAPAAIQAFLDDAARLGVELNSFMIWRGGAVIAEGSWWPYGPARRHMMHSATKSFLSAGVGLALSEGRFALEDRVVSFFPDELPTAVSANLARMTVEDLLTQTSGHAQGASGSIWRGIATSWIAEFFKIPVVYAPGSTFKYTSANSFMLSAILSRTTGQTAHDYLEPRFLRPLGVSGLTWDLGPGNLNPGGNGISCRTADLLKLAVVHLQQGVWDGRQLLPADWVRQATTPQRGNPHGYHWWMGPGGSYYAYGIFGQFAVVLPEHDAVLAVTAATPPGEETLRSLIWRHFPAIFEASRQVPTATPKDAALPKRWARLRLLPPLQPAGSPTAARVSGKTFAAEPNEDGVSAMRLEFASGRCVFHLQDGRGAHTLEVGLADWLEGDTTISGAPLHHGYEPESLRVVAAGRWLDPDCFEMTWQFVESSFRDRVVLRFSGDVLSFDRSVNVNSGAKIRPTIHARRANDTPDVAPQARKRP